VFAARRGAERYGVGDTPSLADGPLLIEADVGADAYIRLIVNGEPRASGVRRIRQSVAEAGVYRLEGYWGGKAWLFTNPIYLGD
jgi:hypothetical protein